MVSVNIITYTCFIYSDDRRQMFRIATRRKAKLCTWSYCSWIQLKPNEEAEAKTKKLHTDFIQVPIIIILLVKESLGGFSSSHHHGSGYASITKGRLERCLQRYSQIAHWQKKNRLPTNTTLWEKWPFLTNWATTCIGQVLIM